MRFEIIRFPSDDKNLSAVLEQLSPYIYAMCTPEDIELFGDVEFSFEHWLFLWEHKAGFFVAQKDDKGDIAMLSIVTQFSDMWHKRNRLEIHRTVMVSDVTINEQDEIKQMVDYLINNADALNFDLLYYNSRDGKGNEFKELVWSRTHGYRR